jgi:HSP20 family protein
MSLLSRRSHLQTTPADYFNSLLNQVLTTAASDQSTIDTTLWSPSVDIKEDAKKYTVLADLPGVEDKDLDVSLENNILTIKGVRQFVAEEKEEAFSRTERFEGQFYRRFTLPDAIDGSKIEASYKKGVLRVVIPKKTSTQVKKITVRSAS